MLFRILLAAVALAVTAPLASAQTETKAPPPAAPVKPFKPEPMSKLMEKFLATQQTRGVAKIFSQQVAYMIPRGYRAYADGEDGDFYIVQLGPDGEDTSNWSQSIQIVGYRGLGGVPELTAQAMAQTLSTPGEGVCKDNWVSADLGPLTIDSYPAHGIMVGCATSAKPEDAKGTVANGQQAVILVIRALYDIYTVQISFRGQPFDKAKMPVNEAAARTLLARLQPVAICAISLEVPECVARQSAMMAK
jgi:hypothetical protein